MRKERKIIGSMVALSILCVGTTVACAPATPGTVKSYLKQITSEARSVSLSSKQDPIAQLSSNLNDWGYDISYDEFEGQTSLGEDFTSKNVIAKRKVDDADADILIVSAHIDSIASAKGAIDNASGVAALEDIAFKIKNLPTDTEIWFTIFSGEEEGLLGSTHFAQSISEKEKGRIIGDIQMDMLGHYLTEGYNVDTVNGKSNHLAELLVKEVKEKTGDAIEISQEQSSDHVAFSVAGIPSVMLTQHCDAHENHAVMDDIDQVDMKKLQTGADIVQSVVEQIMSEDTTDLAKDA